MLMRSPHFTNFNFDAWKILIKFILKFIHEIRFDKFAICLDRMDAVTATAAAVIVIVIIVFTVIADGNAANTANTVPLPLMLGFPCLTLHSFDTLICYHYCCCCFFPFFFLHQ